RADQALPLAEVEEELVGGRVAPPQPLVEGGGGSARRVEGMAGDDLEQVAARETLPGPLDDARVGTRFRAGRGRPRGPAGRHGRRLAGQAAGGGTGHLELVAVPGGRLALAVEHVELVGQVQD